MNEIRCLIFASFLQTLLILYIYFFYEDKLVIHIVVDEEENYF